MKHSKKFIFTRFIISYLIIILIPFIALLLVVKNTEHYVKNDISEKNYETLQFVLREIEDSIIDVNKACERAVKSARILRSEGGSIYGEDYVFNMLMLSKKMNTIVSADKTLAGLMLYMNDSDIFISNYGNMYSVEDTSKILGDSIDISGLSEMKSPLFGTPVVYENIRVVPYIIPSDGQVPGYAVAFINIEKLVSAMKSFDTEKSSTFILSESGNVIYGGNDIENYLSYISDDGFFEKNINGRRSLVMTHTSPILGLKAIIVTPTSKVYSDVHSAVMLIFTVGILIFTLCGGVAYFISKRKILKISEIADKVSGDADECYNDIYRYISEGMKGFRHENAELEKRIKSSDKIVEKEKVSRLLRGNYNTDVSELLENTRIDTTKERYVLIVCTISDISKEEFIGEYYAQLSTVFSYMEYKIGSDGYVYLEDGDFICVILSPPKENSIIFTEKLCRNIINKMYELNKINIIFGVSDVYMSIDNTAVALIQAKTAMEYNKITYSQGIKMYSEMPKKSDFYYFPYDLEVNLINFVQSGNKNGVHMILKEMYEENIMNRKLSFEMINLFVEALKGTLFRLFEATPESKVAELLFERIEKKQNSAEALSIVTQCFYELCGEPKKKSKVATDRITDIIEYIDNNFADKNLSVVALSERFDISEKYLSNIFKNRTRITVSGYIEKRRLEAAENLLKNTDKTVSEIALECGYNNDTTFRRSFKKINGISPVQWRELNLGKEAMSDDDSN